MSSAWAKMEECGFWHALPERSADSAATAGQGGQSGAETLQWLRGIASGHKEELRYDDNSNRGLNWQMGRGLLLESGSCQLRVHGCRSA